MAQTVNDEPRTDGLHFALDLSPGQGDSMIQTARLHIASGLLPRQSYSTLHTARLYFVFSLSPRQSYSTIQTVRCESIGLLLSLVHFTSADCMTVLAGLSYIDPGDDAMVVTPTEDLVQPSCLFNVKLFYSPSSPDV